MEQSITPCLSTAADLELDRLELLYAAEMDACGVGTVDQLIDCLDRHLRYTKGHQTPLERTMLAIRRSKDDSTPAYPTLDQIVEKYNLLMHSYGVVDLAGLIDAQQREITELEARRIAA